MPENYRGGGDNRLSADERKWDIHPSGTGERLETDSGALARLSHLERTPCQAGGGAGNRSPN